ncbi:hypothetical protein Tco_0911697 [Tanacetum coccineum]|uniref:Transposase n=1 Tax=Tanacetum coccineum TaxID=301880 RepID=A0ABQ5CY10_9ASTR
MTTLKFADTLNMVAFLSKPAESDRFEQIVDFLNAQPIRYALTVNPTIHISCIEQFWSTGVVKSSNEECNTNHKWVKVKQIQLIHHTPTIIQPSTQLQKTQKPRKPKRKDTQVPQPSDPSENVADEAVYKELGDSLVRAATTASSLEAEQDSGNITKTRSKATPNETTSGGGPRLPRNHGGYYCSN